MASSADVATPYEQPHHYSKRAPSAAPSAATRARAAVAARVERDNAHVARRLAELREEGPSSFHAPDGAASLKTTTTTTTARRRARRAAASSSSAASTRTSSSRAHDRGVDKDATARNSYPSTRSWPPRRAPAFDGRLRAERLRVREGNRALREMLVNQHKASRDSQLVREGKGRPVDGLSMWRKRMQLYDDRPPNLAGTVDEDGKCVATGVPKAMAVARCSATGLYTYFGADGHKLREHRECPGLFYCDEWFDEFAALDRVSQRQLVDYYSGRTPSWHPARPPTESWVVNRHMKLGLSMMRRMAKGDDSVTVESIKEAVAKCKLRERLLDKAEAKKKSEMDALAREERQAVSAQRVSGPAESAEAASREPREDAGGRGRSASASSGKDEKRSVAAPVASGDATTKISTKISTTTKTSSAASGSAKRTATKTSSGAETSRTATAAAARDSARAA